MMAWEMALHMMAFEQEWRRGLDALALIAETKRAKVSKSCHVVCMKGSGLNTRFFSFVL